MLSHMLETLHRIVKEVNTARDLESALEIIVSRVKQAVKADVCSVYLTDPEHRDMTLMATDGLDPAAVGKVRLPLGQGLIGVVAERAENLNLADAPDHPRYVFAAETGEARYHGFLGVPIIQAGRVLGVLVVRQRAPRAFAEDEVTFLFTLAAQLAGAITHARASGELRRLQQRRGGLPNHFLEGRAASTGIGLGTAVVVYPPARLEEVPDRRAEDPDAEEEAFRTAVAGVVQDLMELADRFEDELPAEELALFDAWLMMLESDTLVEGTVKAIRDGSWAPGALREVILDHVRRFDEMEDPYLRERAQDVMDLGRRILAHLQHAEPRTRDWPERTVLVGDEISPMQLAEVPDGQLAGLASVRGTGSSHIAILARGMGVPAVMGVEGLPAAQVDGLEMVVDGYLGRIYVAPTPAIRDQYERIQANDRRLDRQLESLADQPAATADGHRVPLLLNTGLVSEARPLGIEETDGVGLYRTELPFMLRDRFPSEEVQTANYRNVLSTFYPNPVTIRTLDIGGDKPLPYFPVEEPNPFLGWRGIRISLDHPEILIPQLRAMLRADVGLSNLRVLLPMITTLDELERAWHYLHQAHDELKEEGLAVGMPPLGAMIETPAAVLQAAALARRCDFLSVGTNDLTQYLLAVDRNNAHVADLYDDLHPVVLRALCDVVEAAHAAGRQVSVCGEMAGHRLAALLLVGMGVDQLSMGAGSVRPVKYVLRHFRRDEMRALLQQALACEDTACVREGVKAALAAKGLCGLVGPA